MSNPEQQYRELTPGEIIQPGDEWLDYDGKWREKALPGGTYNPDPTLLANSYHAPHRRPLHLVDDWESLYRKQVAATDEWKGARQKLLDEVNKLTAQRDEWKEVAANAERATQRAKRERDEFAKRLEESTKVIAQSENQNLNVELSLARTMLNGQERRHKEEVAKLNANYLQVMTERDGMRRALDDVAMASEAWMPKPPENLREDIIRAINCRSAENGSDTPDWILGNFLIASLAAFDVAVRDRTQYYGEHGPIPTTPPIG